MSPDALAFTIDPAALRPLIGEIVREVLDQVQQDGARLGGDRLAYGEAEAARLLSLHGHQLRDARRRGEIQETKGPGGKVLYTRDDLVAYLHSRRLGDAPARRRGRQQSA